LEAILSAFFFAGGVIVMTKLVKRHTTIEVTGASLLISGLILAILLVLSTSQISIPTVPEWIFLVFFSLLPLAAALLYVIELDRIGASLTSTIASSNILFTLFLQLLFKGLGVKSNLPENILLALIGGVLGLYGIYLVHIEKDYILRKRDIGN
jgi:drug/metabolite transporter (DMT)-like permease